MSSENLFGTDGVRGIPGHYPLTKEVIREIARLVAEALARRAALNGGPPTVLMGRDTRGSGPWVARALAGGFQAAGCGTLDLGVAPTPAVSYLTPRLKSVCGVTISASHNPAEFNGIKFFTGGGLKLSSTFEDDIEARLKNRPERSGRASRSGPRLKKTSFKAEPAAKHLARYIEFLRSTFPATADLTGLKLVVDCGNGAASKLGPALFEGLGAEVFPIGISPNGRNINSGCGALETAAMQKAVLKHRAHAGVSFDGDADRAIFSDEKGRIIDGDAIICLSALRLLERGELAGGGVVLTVMSNFGLLRFLKDKGISVETVSVGDRNVTDAMRRRSWSLGGETSGHIVYSQFSATGDGLLTALQTLAALRESGRPLSAVRALYRKVPQILTNLPVAHKIPLDELPRVVGRIRRFQTALKGSGRVFVRYSGTEPTLRIMLEGPRRAELGRMAKDLARLYLRETAQEKVNIRQSSKGETYGANFSS